MTTNENAVSAVHLRGETCNLTNVHGVKTFVTKGGLDIINVAEGLHDTLTKVNALMKELNSRVDDLSSRVALVEKNSSRIDELTARVAVSEKTNSNQRVDDLSNRFSGLSSRIDDLGSRVSTFDELGSRVTSIENKRQPKLQELSDVNATGITDGAILVFRKGKFVAELTEE
jgi:hypothetical protein